MSAYWEKAGSWRTGPKQDREFKKSSFGDSSEWERKRDTSYGKQEKEECWLQEHMGKSWEGTR